MPNSNQTAEDARVRVFDARNGCLAGATDKYLSALRIEIVHWLSSIDEEMAIRNETRFLQIEREGTPTRKFLSGRV